MMFKKFTIIGKFQRSQRFKDAMGTMGTVPVASFSLERINLLRQVIRTGQGFEVRATIKVTGRYDSYDDYDQAVLLLINQLY